VSNFIKQKQTIIGRLAGLLVANPCLNLRLCGCTSVSERNPVSSANRKSDLAKVWILD